MSAPSECWAFRNQAPRLQEAFEQCDTDALWSRFSFALEEGLLSAVGLNDDGVLKCEKSKFKGRGKVKIAVNLSVS